MAVIINARKHVHGLILFSAFVHWTVCGGDAARIETKVGLDPKTAGVEYVGWQMGEAGWRDAGEGSEIRVALSPGTYYLTVTLYDSQAAQHKEDRLNLTVNGKDVGTFQRSKAEGWSAWNVVVPADAFVKADKQVLRFVRTGKPIAVKEVRACNFSPPPPSRLKRAGWNAYATHFMYPPTLYVTALPDAASYRCIVTVDAVEHEVRSEQPALDLTPIWDALRCGRSHTATLQALDANGRPIEATTAGFFKIASFTGEYPKATREYTESGRKCAEYVFGTLAHWKTGEQDLGAYPDLFGAAYIRVLLTYAELEPKSEKAPEAVAIAQKIGRKLIASSTGNECVYAHMPPSHGPGVLQVSRTAMVGMAYLDLLRVTKGTEFLDVANRIADTLKATQLPEGRWYFRVNPANGKVVEDYTSDQAEAIFFLDELIANHDRKDLTETRDRAVAWTLDNPVKTRHWQQQWDDVGTCAPYSNLEFYDTVFFALYLLKHATPDNGYCRVACDLFRYIEDQFVLWENSRNRKFITPGVLEQYRCYEVIDWHAAHVIRLCQALHEATGEDIYLRKAQALADTLTVVQHAQGYYPTWMRYKPAKDPAEPRVVDYGGLWPNCMSYTAEILMKFGQYVARREKR
ncbi:MAG: hypothetical protein NTW87_09855 [Planctomycetota bacterium]|nr:hypothetical protein [Planctomycetota bacterium]